VQLCLPTEDDAALADGFTQREPLALLPSYQRNAVDLPEGSFVTNLGGLRVNVTPTNNFIINAFLQYNDASDRVSTNLRIDYIYRPGEECTFREEATSYPWIGSK